MFCSSMEIHPILEHSDSLKPNLWYVLSPKGEAPSVRVGHTCTFLTGVQGNENSTSKCGRVVVIGGANPDGPFDDVFVLDLALQKWTNPEWKGVTARYEHSAFVPECSYDTVLVFGGAQQATNLNDVQAVDTAKGLCTTVEVSGNRPSTRTAHSMASIGNKLYIFGGGLSGAEPVQDTQMHVYDAVTKSWSQPEVKGIPPSCRHGHIMVAMGTCIFIHGGMAGTNMHDDLFKFDTEDHTWSQVSCTGEIPSARTAHAATVVGKMVYMFGGMSSVGRTLDDFYVLNTENLKWHKLKPDGPPPSARLDHAMCLVKLPSKTGDSEASAGAVPQQTAVLVFGGMDTHGEIFNDCLVYLVEDNEKTDWVLPLEEKSQS